MQIIHSRGNHWIVASSLGCSDNQVNVFDSLYTSVDEDTKSVIFNLFEFEGEPKLNIINIQVQDGVDDCEIFAIAYITALAFDTEPAQFQQSLMREHILKCFQDRMMVPFPPPSKFNLTM